MVRQPSPYRQFNRRPHSDPHFAGCAQILDTFEGAVLLEYFSLRAREHLPKRSATLCQNCVTYPPKPWVNTVTYGDTSTHIVVG